jgi:FMN-dependent NADH-azoreductase
VSKLLYIEASPSKRRSHTVAVAHAFLEAYGSTHPHEQIDRLDLWEASLPPFDAETLEAKFAVLRRNEFTPEQFARWESVRAVSRRFNSADKYVFSVPMWNFGVPYPLKHYIDVVTLPGENWTWSKADGYGTLFSGKKALLITASANDYATPQMKGSDFLKPYLRRWLRFVGIEDVEEIDIAPTLADAAAVADARGKAMSTATALAGRF